MLHRHELHLGVLNLSLLWILYNLAVQRVHHRSRPSLHLYGSIEVLVLNLHAVMILHKLLLVIHHRALVLVICLWQRLERRHDLHSVLVNRHVLLSSKLDVRRVRFHLLAELTITHSGLFEEHVQSS